MPSLIAPAVRGVSGQRRGISLRVADRKRADTRAQGSPVHIVLGSIFTARIDEVVLLEAFLGRQLFVALRFVAEIVFVGRRVLDAFEQIVRQSRLIVLFEHVPGSRHVGSLLNRKSTRLNSSHMSIS